MRYSVAFFLPLAIMIVAYGCKPAGSVALKPAENTSTLKLVTLDPGHFHAALVQKETYPGIDPQVYVYAPGGAELQSYLALITQYNQRTDNPTHWVEKTYTGTDYLEKMLVEKKGNVVVLAGNNRQKTEYIQKAIDAGFNVLGDKPMAINTTNFNALKQAFEEAGNKKLLLYDIMTERSEITNILQKELAAIPEVFGELKKGTLAEPSVMLESVHFFYKYVSGKVLTRPSWFFDPAQQGEAIADVGTHLIDLAQWECFPGKTIDYKKDINILSARIWPTPVSLFQFGLITGQTAFPSYLQQYVQPDTILQAHGNGEINYTLNDVHVKVIARWEYKAPEGSGDTHYSILKGTKADMEIRQGKEEGFQPTLYIRPASTQQETDYAVALENAIKKLQASYPGVAVVKTSGGWKMDIPQKYKIGHEAHFAQVMQRYLQYLREGKLPAWEIPGMLAKYYTATKGLEKAVSK